jgi:hypothetical protein
LAIRCKSFTLKNKKHKPLATNKPRINIKCEQEIMRLLTDLAKKRDQPTAGFAKALTFEALERRKDVAWSKLARIRDIAIVTRISHNSAWK